ncbi:MAG: gamma-glutamyltransferase [Chromatiales bacterium]|nr:gamma-glutamyltransferase [Chromatiales bacterium]
MRLTGLALLLPMLAGVPAANGVERGTDKDFATRSEVIATHGMAATSQPLATQIALDILKRGGSAVDAAIAANAALGLMEPTGSGIGGNLFAIVWEEKSRRLWGLNASGRSPQSLTFQYFLDRKMQRIPGYGVLPVSVPGAVDGWFELHDRFGRLPMSEILQPAIDYARDGFPVSALIARGWARNARALKDYAGFAATFMPGGKTPSKGDIFKNPRLANTYSRIAARGRDVFYRGSIAREIADHMEQHGGFLSAVDLTQHRSEWVEPIGTNYRGYTLWELPPNGQGIAALQILNILEPYPLHEMGFGSVDHVHTFVEAKKLAYEDRARFYADPDFSDIPVTALTSKKYADQRRKLLSPKKAAASYPAGNPALETGDTIYLTVADAEGNMVSLIQSNYRGMGSGVTPGELGFVLQDRGELFSLEPGHPNVYAPGKRPFHTIIPAFVTLDGYRYLSFGVMGGSMQPQGHVQILMNLIDFGMNLQEAGDAPRIHHAGSSQPTGELMRDGGKIFLEPGYPQETWRELEARGHQLGKRPGIFGGYQAVMWDDERKVYLGASESRKDGHAAGY